MLAGTTCFLP
uniref:Uncharacterized protein n=1 Tax=Rhizophora mucronata TaxID=61149 RepID=A0A2P2MW52_RHIMU